jgi:tripartite-type tricarboxylate transporter receptor subunit TctC
VIRSFFGAGALAVITLLAVPEAVAEPYPSRTIRIVVPYAAGGPVDFIARVVAEKLTGAWAHPVIVENQPGAGGNIGVQRVAKAPPDGYTLAFVSTAFVVNPSLYAAAGYDALADFMPVSLAAVSPVIIVANPSFPANNVGELVKVAKQKSINYASPGVGTTGHLGGELFNKLAGTRMQQVAYKGAAPAITDVLGGHVPLGFTAVPPVVPHIQSGKLKAIAVTTKSRTATLPKVPTVIESGLPGYEVDNMYGVIAPARTPEAMVRKLNREITRIVHDSEVKQRLTSQGFDPMGTTPEAFASYLRSESAKWSEVVKKSGARAE